MKAIERRQELLNTLCRRRHDKIDNLAFEFCVSERTIRRDIQELSLSYPIYTDSRRNVLISYDTYYVRTQKRDKEYEYGMSEKQNIDGKRMRTSMYARRYVE